MVLACTGVSGGWLGVRDKGDGSMRKPLVIGIHGFNVSDAGAGTIGKLQYPFELKGMDFQVMGYPWTFVIRLNTTTRAAVLKLLELAEEYQIDGIVAHSHGNVIVHEALCRGLKLKWWGMVNPALNVRTTIPEGVDKVDLWYSSGDRYTQLGRYWRWFTRLFPWRWRNRHHWGQAGRKGLKTKDPRLTQHILPHNARHSGALHDTEWQHHIAVCARNALIGSKL